MRLLIADSRLRIDCRLVIGATVFFGAVTLGAQQRTEPTRIAALHLETLRPEILGTRGIVAGGRHYSVSAGVRIMLD